MVPAPGTMDLLRFSTAGSVDDGKSTLIGRLLYDSKSIFTDQLEAVERTSRERGDDYTDLALLTDGLRAERAPQIDWSRLDVWPSRPRAYRLVSNVRVVGKVEAVRDASGLVPVSHREK